MLLAIDDDAGSRGGGGEDGGDRGPASRYEAALALVATSSGLKMRTIRVAGRSTTVRLEPATWTALTEVARESGRTISAVLTAIDAQRGPGVSLSSAIRSFLLAYYKGR